jgi:hypothetical protein
MGKQELTVKILHKNCDPSLGDDRSLPYTAYIVEYCDEGETNYDIVIGNKKADIFDYYWDRYREGLVNFKQTEGRANPKLWSLNNKEKKKK